MPKSTKNTRKTNTSRATKSPVRATSKKSSNKKSSVVFGRLMPKRRGHWAVLIVVVLLIGAIGSYFIYSSNAVTTNLSPDQCKIRGREGSWDYSKDTYTCTNACRPYAGDWIYNPDGYGWCSHAISTSIGQDRCSSLGRKFVGAVGCARNWHQYQYPNQNVFVDAIQCAHDGDDYHVTNTIDYCGSGSGTPSNGIIVGSIPGAPVGGAWKGNGISNCVPFVQWIVNKHSDRYDGHPMGVNGNGLAGAFRSQYGWKNLRAPGSVVSWPAGGVPGVGGAAAAYYGHTALVDTVKANGDIVVEESNYLAQYDIRTVPASTAAELNYAYVADWN